MSAGMLRHRVTLLELVETTNAYGEPEAHYVPPLVTASLVSAAVHQAGNPTQIAGLTFTAAAAGVPADRTYSHGATAAESMSHLAALVNDAMWGAPGVTATAVAGVITLAATAGSFTAIGNERVTVTPLTWEQVWGLVEDTKGSERYLAKQAQSEVDVRVLIRYRDGVSPTMRVRHGTRTLQIDFVRRPDDRRRYLELHCRELPSDGT